MRITFATNEPRSQYLLAALRAETPAVAEVNFDDIDVVTKYTAALLSIKYPRVEWYRNYQMHPLLQRRRRRVLQHSFDSAGGKVDALLMWGSWFHPWKHRSQAVRYFNYIDQSLSLTPALGEPQTSSWGRRRAHQLQNETYRDSSGIFCMSRWARDQTVLAHPQLNPGKIHVVGWGPCGVDLSSEDPSTWRKEQLILHISNNFHRKGVDFLVDTAVEVAHTHPDAQFVVIGADEGPPFRLRQPNNVRFLGPIHDRAVLASYFRRASVFFLPHRFDRSPHVFAEALSAGVPIVTSRQGGPIEVTDGTGAGFCIDVGDIRGYAEAVRELLSVPEKVRTMGLEGLKLMRAYYNWPSVARNILSLMAANAA